MQIFELHFNPKLREGQIFDSFVYEPENIYERKLGNLCVTGELRNTLPQNLKFLDNLAKVIKRNFYALSLKSPEKALSETLKKANEYLGEEVKRENVSWLGNLNFAVLSLRGPNLIFTKTGNLKILLLRGGQIIDIGKNLDLNEIEPYPLKIFFNIVSGKLSLNDIILVLTKEVFEFLYQQNILTKIAQASRQGGIDSKKIKEIFPSFLFTKDEGSKISGICFLSIIRAEPSVVKRPKAILFQKEEKFSFCQFFSPLSRPIKTILNFLKRSFKFLKKISEKKKISLKIPLPKLPNLKIPTKKELKRLLPIIKIPKIKSFIKFPGPLIEKFPYRPSIKKLILILVLILFLSLGFLIFKKTEEKKETETKVSLTEIQEKVNQAENFLIFKNEEKANSLLKEAWREILPLTKVKTSNIIDLKQSIEKELEGLNKLEKIENPEIIYEFKPEESEIEYKKLLSSLSSSVLFFIPPNNLFVLENGEWQEEKIPLPEFDFSLDFFSSYNLNLYFLDRKTCKIIKYPYLGNLNWGSPGIWKEQNDNCSEPKSMTIDGSVWILNKDNSLIRYRLGSYQETISLDFFPFPENIAQIKTTPTLSYLYLLEPLKKRVIIIEKTGKIVKQFQSEKFDNLKDFSVSEDGKTIWLLNDSKIYKIEL